jgi:hypothetical protein
MKTTIQAARKARKYRNQDFDHEAVSLAFNLGHKIKDAYKQGLITLDFNGHCMDGQVRPQSIERDLDLLFITGDLSKAKLQAALIALEQHVSILAEPIQVSHGMMDCYTCGDHLRWDYNGQTLKCRTPCVFKDGLKPTSFDLNIPSGKMIVANDLRDLFRIAGDYNVNTVLGEIQTTQKYAEAGLAHGFVGNTCPGVYAFTHDKPHRQFILGPGPYQGSRRVAGVCTDLWWYSIADKDEVDRRLKERGYKPNPKFYKEHNMDVVTCRPGVYTFSQEYHTLANRDAKGAIYARWQWSKDPEPVKDYEALYKSLNFTAGQLIRDSIARYPTLYKVGSLLDGGNELDVMQQVQRVADHIFLTNGNGLTLHPNGWIGDCPDLKPDAPDMEIPQLKGKFRWYPGGNWCYLAHCAGFSHPLYADRREGNPDLNESFTALAFNICHNIITDGCDVIGADRKDDQREENELGVLARRAFRALVKRYPQRVPDYCNAIRKRTRA